MGIRIAGGRRLFRCPRLGPVVSEGSQEEGLRLRELFEPRRLRALGTAAAAPGQLLPAGSGHRRALPRMPALCPRPAPSAPASRARTHHRLHTPTADRCPQAAFSPLGTRGFTTCLHNFNVCNYGFCVGLCFCTSALLYFSHANTPQGTAAEKRTHATSNLFGEWFSSFWKQSLVNLFSDFKNQLDCTRTA